MTDDFEIAGSTVKPGTSMRLGMPAGRLFTQQVIEIPLTVLHGAQPGPTVWMSAAIHGDEISGTEVVRRVIEALDPADMKGTLLALPVVNVFGFVQHTRYLPDRRDLNRFFPGAADGSLASQIAHLLMTNVVRRSDFGIDLHAGSDHRTNLPQIRADLDDAQVRALCEAFGAPVALHAPLRRGSLRYAAARAKVPCLLYEAGEPMRFDRAAVSTGTDGVLRVLQHLGVIEDAPALEVATRFALKSRWMRASRAGVAHLDVALGEDVRPGQVVALLRDIDGDVVGRLRAQRGGIVIGHTLNPLVSRGDAVLHLASLEA